ncbi:PAS domain-containing sensor histidine kinase [Telluribacter humicola]|uniref:PAS domain-containing sensor histidine kinase n=1 Tax=Telluribacter humicola TaxID=1720261 RepID=UPI001E4C1B2A|nr:PAS domain-containing sensor histidine kinase [Telluribacter humicola]
MKRHIEMLDALFKHATEGIVVVDGGGNIFMVNPKARLMFGYDEGELIGEKIEVLVPRRHAKAHVQNRVGYSQGPHARGMGSSLDLFARRSDGSEFPVEVSLSPFSTSEGDFVVSFIVDITERKKQEDAIRVANQEIQKLNAELEERVEQRTRELGEAMRKLEESQHEVMRALEKERELNDMKSKFVTIASHEFRTPLATILSSASLIGRYSRTEDEDKRQKHVLRIKSAVNNLTEILNDFLSIGKLEEGKVHTVPVEVNLPDFCKDLIEEIRGVCKDQQRIYFEHQGPEDAWLDKQLLKNVTINLLSNAIKYSEAGTSIYLRTRTDEETVYFEIEDQGIGIPEKDQPYVFDRFFRAQNAGNAQGTGLGLNIVKKYIDLLNGEITFKSEFGKGTTFYVKLPNHKQVLV